MVVGADKGLAGGDGGPKRERGNAKEREAVSRGTEKLPVVMRYGELEENSPCLAAVVGTLRVRGLVGG